MTFAASQAFPLQELARNQAAEFRHQSHHLLLLRPLARALAPLLSRIAERVVLHYAQRFAQTALWFRGACHSVDTAPSDTEIDAQDVLRGALDDMEFQLAGAAAGARQLAADLRRHTKARRGRVRDALERLALACDELRQEVRSFKGAVQAHDANVFAIQRAMRVCHTPEELQAALDRLQA